MISRGYSPVCSAPCCNIDLHPYLNSYTGFDHTTFALQNRWSFATHVIAPVFLSRHRRRRCETLVCTALSYTSTFIHLRFDLWLAAMASRPAPPGARKPMRPINTSGPAIARGATARSAMSPRVMSPTDRNYARGASPVVSDTASREDLSDDLRREAELREQVYYTPLRSRLSRSTYHPFV
jgi:hypothetical protein